MITIPKNIRKKYGIKTGSEIAVIEVDGNITIIPIMSIEELEASRKTSLAEAEQAFKEIKDEEMELER